MTIQADELKPSLILYYYPRQENESFEEAQANAKKFSDLDQFSLILCGTREANHSGGDFIDEIGHYYFGMKSRVKGKTISTPVWYAPKNLVAHLCEPEYDFKALIASTGKSPIVLMDIFPKCIVNEEKNKGDIRRGQTSLELQSHFNKILSYENLRARIKLVIFSLEPSIGDGREEKHRDARELFQDMIKKHYGEKEYLNVPFFAQGPRKFMHVEYSGAQMHILSKGIT